jgi:hypothetical protein
VVSRLASLTARIDYYLNSDNCNSSCTGVSRSYTGNGRSNYPLQQQSEAAVCPFFTLAINTPKRRCFHPQ